MSNYQAIAGVSKSLQKLLRDRMEAPPAEVTIAPPDVQIGGTGTRLNLYLYYIRQSSALRNQEIPGNGHPAAYGFPPLPLELYYLITAGGGAEDSPDADLKAQQILGDAMRVLNDYPVITDTLTLVSSGTGSDRMLEPVLRGEHEQVKITFEPLTVDDLSKIWTAMSQSNFRRSVAYQVSVVQIESERKRVSPAPVESRVITMPPSARPEITSVYDTTAGAARRDYRLRPGDNLTIEGLNFGRAGINRAWVVFNDGTPSSVTQVDSRKIRVNVPDADAIPPGPTRVRVEVELVAESVRGDGLEGRNLAVTTPAYRVVSNEAVFQVTPIINTLALNAGGTTLTIGGVRLWDVDGATSVIIDGDDCEVDTSTAPTPSSIKVKVSGLAAGDHEVRVRVNGALSKSSATLTVP
ncbi:MAG: Pvc16 family protein [Phycisphaerales bacterium]